MRISTAVSIVLVATLMTITPSTAKYCETDKDCLPLQSCAGNSCEYILFTLNDTP